MDDRASAEDPKRHAAWLAAILTGAIVLRLALFLGPRAIDHFLYLEQADAIARGEYAISPLPQATRFGLLVPLAGLIKIAGLNAVSATALTLLASVLHVLSAFWLGEALVSRAAGRLAAALVAILPLDVIHATLLYPDLLATALAMAGFALLVRESRRPQPRSAWILAAGALFGWAWLVKPTVLFVLLFAAGWILKTRRWRLALAAAPVAFALAVEMVAFELLSGDAFYRSREAHPFAVAALFHDYYPRASDIVSRMTWRLPSILFNPLDKEFPYLGLLAWTSAVFAWRARGVPAVRFLLAFCAAVLAGVWIWPLQLRPFLPALIAEARHLLLLAAPMAVIAAAGFATVGPRLRRFALAALAFLSIGGAIFVHVYLARFDAGERTAFAVLRERGARRVRASDGTPLFRYLSGASREWDIRDLALEDLGSLRDSYVVLDDRGRVRGNGVPSQLVPDLTIPPGWELVWSGEFPGRWDPRRPGSARTYRVRVYHAR